MKIFKRLFPSFALFLLLAIFLAVFAPVASADVIMASPVPVITAGGFEGAAQAFLLALTDKFPIIATVLLVLSAAINLFCAIAALTKTDKDDKIASYLKAFLSLNPPPKK